MLIVKREELQKLQEDLQEADKKNDRFSYQEFCAEHQKILRNLESDPKKLMKAYDVLRKGFLLQKKSEIRYVGQGSSRICFALAGGQCLKIAFNEKGVLQNRSEKKISKKFSGLSCFTQIFDSDQSDASLLTECVSPASAEDFLEMLGESHFAVSNVLIEAVRRRDWDLQKKLAEVSEKSDRVSQWMKSFCEKVQNSKSDPQWQVFRDLLMFFKKSGGEKMSSAEELRNFRNWGVGLRDGQEVLLVLDFGLSEDALALYH